MNATTGQFITPGALSIDSSYLYFMGISQGQYQAFRCPLSGGCAGGAQQISTSGSVPTVKDIETAGNLAYWIGASDTVMKADISGATPGAPVQAYKSIGGLAIEQLRSDGSNVYASTTNITSRSHDFITLPGDGSSSFVTPSVLADLNDRHSTVIWVDAGLVTAWAGSAGAPKAIYSNSFAGNASTAISPPQEAIMNDGLLRQNSNIFWLENTGSTKRLMHCLVNCTTPDVVATEVSSFTVSSAGDLFYVQRANGMGHVYRCDAIDVLAALCPTATVSEGFFWVGAYDLKVDAGHVYALAQKAWQQILVAPR